MSYSDNFIPVDNLVVHLSTVIAGIGDPQTQSYYSGFLAVSAVTVYELAIKDIFIEFASKKHKVFGAFTKNSYERMNGRIQLDDLKKQIKTFGNKYLTNFDKLLTERENVLMRAASGSIKTYYNNLITNRHNFVHKGPIMLTFADVVNYYGYGKEIINCLDKAMRR